ncbi:hypothetical protein FRB99_001963 [Tulasnella sp. 403]|nr:hypothetical protein FRB99_001963 [Tulasnella sp. 403]
MTEPTNDPAVSNALLSLFGDYLHNDFVTAAGISSSSNPCDYAKELDTRITIIADRFQRFQTAAALRLSQLRRQRNTLVPVSRLHVEILNKIFFEAMAVDIKPWFEDDTYYVRLFRLSGVCSFWSSVIADQAALWTRIDPEYHPSLVSMALERSKDMPLKVGGRLDTCHEKRVRARTEHFLARWASSMKRWSEAIHIVIRDTKYLILLTTTAAPRLRRLEVLCEARHNRTWDLFRGHAPLLDEIGISWFIPEWTSKIFTGLRSLRLRSTSIPFTCLENILRACPTLTSLALMDIHLGDDDEVSTTEHTPSFVSSLVQITFREIPDTRIALLLSRLTFHHLLEVDIDRCGTINDQDPAILDLVFSSILPGLRNALENMTPESAVLSLDHWNLHFYTVPSAIRLNLSHSKYPDTVDHFVQRVGPLVQPICDTLIVGEHLSDRDFSSVVHYWDAFPSLSHLELKRVRPGRDVADLIGPYSGANNTPRCHLPNLRTIKCCDTNVEVLLYATMERSRLRETPSASDQKSPAALVKLEIRPDRQGHTIQVEDWVYRELKQVFQEVVICGETDAKMTRSHGRRRNW